VGRVSRLVAVKDEDQYDPENFFRVNRTSSPPPKQDEDDRKKAPDEEYERKRHPIRFVENA